MKQFSAPTPLYGEDFPSFLARFGSFHDSVVRNITIDFVGQPHPKNVMVRLSAQDLQAPSDNQWVDVMFDLVDVREFTIVEKRTTSFVVVYELMIDFVDDLMRFDFDSTNDVGSDFLVVAKQCFGQ